jgi:hypothetical protein
MVTYIIHREGEEKDLKEVTLTAKEIIRRRVHKRRITPDRSLKVNNHSPTGFEFGYGGSGPAQLALAILLDFTNDNKIASALHQELKWRFIAPMKHPGGEISEVQIKEFLREQPLSEYD